MVQFIIAFLKNFLSKKINYLFFLIFFIPAVFSISDYNVNWDEPEHFRRGQAIIRYFLTKETDYNKLPQYDEFRKSPQNNNTRYDKLVPRYSFYQNKILDGNYYLQKDDGGHPPLADILATLTNYVFYQKLNILSDTEAYHLFIVVISSILVFLVSLWVYKDYGFFPSLIATLSLSLYPLFFADSHNNIKDPAEATFFALTIYIFYQGIAKERKLLVLLSSLFFGMAFATKFNVLFLPFILLPWLLIYYGRRLFRIKKFLLPLFFYPFVAFVILFASWPFLWFNSLTRIAAVFGYYKTMGTSDVYTQPSNFYFLGFNTYPLQTIVFTTPLVILFLSLLGIIYVFIRGLREKNKTSILILLWFLVPIFRVTIPGTSIYGGVRQIMEYIPAMAILSGIGANYLVKILSGFLVRMTLCHRTQNSKLKTQNYISNLKSFLNKNIIRVLIILSFLPISLKLISIHPNENVYFNPLIGGLKGAKEKSYPYWGFNLGSSYKQGVDWLNKNAEKNANVAMVVSTGSNIPKAYFRSDLNFYNGAWSGTERKGEYLIEAIFNGWIREWHHAGDYVDKILEPVYEVKVDGVAIVKVWKNDQEHTYSRFLKEDWLDFLEFNWRQEENLLIIEMKGIYELMSISLDVQNEECFDFKDGLVFLSLDGNIWQKEREPIRGMYKSGNKLLYPLVAKKARYVRMEIGQTSCPFSINKVNISFIKS